MCGLSCHFGLLLKLRAVSQTTGRWKAFGCRLLRGIVIVLLILRIYIYLFFNDTIGMLCYRVATITRVTSSLALAIRMRRFPLLLEWLQEPNWRFSTCTMYASVLSSDVNRRRDPCLSIMYFATVGQGQTVWPPDHSTILFKVFFRYCFPPVKPPDQSMAAIKTPPHFSYPLSVLFLVLIPEGRLMVAWTSRMTWLGCGVLSTPRVQGNKPKCI